MLENGSFSQLIGFVLNACVNRDSNFDFVEKFITVLSSNTEKGLDAENYDESKIMIANPYTQRLVICLHNFQADFFR